MTRLNKRNMDFLFGWWLPRACLLPLLLMLSLAHAESGAEDPHAPVFAGNEFPSAVECGSCHPRIFREWASSNHAYASISPMFHKFEQAINDLSSGTIGTFCVRCHQTIGTQKGELREAPLWDRSTVAREGVTCVTCHRVGAAYGKVNGERDISPGDIFAPVLNSGTATALQSVIENKEKYQVATSADEKGTPIHLSSVKFEQINQSEFCVSCHQVAVNLGIKLEVVWEQYRASPAHKEGVACQECHMGAVPGEAKGYDTGPIAMVNGRAVGNKNAKHSNHSFYGPGYPIAHPGIFPFNGKALRWSIKQWLTFSYEQPWGKLQWERDLAAGKVDKPDFPKPWDSRRNREDARQIINSNEKLLDVKKKSRIAVMENGSRIDGPFFSKTPKAGKSLKFKYTVTNTDIGHNLPSGSLGAQPEIWMNVALIDPDGERVWESGYVDSYGDMADLHSLDYAQGKIEHDDQLFNLQTKFLTTNVKGTDREMYLPVNFDVDQRPHLRPANVPASVQNHPPFVRMEGRSIPPLGSRDARYKVPSKHMQKKGTYQLLVRMRSRAEPIYFMKFVGATRSMEKRINEWMIDIHPYAVEFEVK